MLALVVLVGFQAFLFRDLVRDPAGLIVDADRPSRDTYRTGPNTVGNDLTRLFLPMHQALADQVHVLGRLPTWDDRGFAGRPMVGNPQASLFYPPAWIVWISRSPAALGWLTVGHLVFLGMGGFTLCRTQGASVQAALFAAICLSGNPYVLAQVAEGHLPHVWCVSWFPWVIGLLWQGGRCRALLAAGCLALSFLAGHLQEWFYFNLAIAAAVVVALIRDRRSAGPLLVNLGIVWGLTLCLIAVELVPDLLVRGHLVRSEGQSLSTAARYSVGFSNLLQLANPLALGGPGDYRGIGNYWETVLSIGLIPLSFLLAAVCHRETRSRVRFWVWSLVLAVLVSVGPSLGLFAALYYVVPWMDSFRVPARALFLVSIPASLLAGMGFDLVRRRGWPPIALGLTITAVLADALVESFPLASLACLALFAGDWAWRWRNRDGDHFTNGRGKENRSPLTLRWLPAPGAIVVLLLGAAELAWHASFAVKVSEASRWFPADPVASLIRDDHRDSSHRARIRCDDSLYSDLLAEAAGLEKTNVGDSFQLDRTSRLYRRLYRLFDPSADDALPSRLRPSDEILDRLARVVLDLMSVEYVVAAELPPGPVRDWPVLGSGNVAGSRLTVLKNPSPLPRAFVVGRAVPPASVRNPVDDLLTLNPRESVLLASDVLGDGPRSGFRAVGVESSAPDRYRLAFELDAPGYLVLNEAWAPGWSATINGRVSAVLVGNVGFCVVPVRTSGSVAVELRYDPPGFRLGLVVSSIGFLGWTTWLVRAGRLAQTDVVDSACGRD